MMATTLNTEHPTSRQDSFHIHPDDVVPGRNSRVIPAADYPETVKRRAVEIAKEGQLVPILGHKNGEGKFVVDEGFTRLDAIKLLRQGFTAADPEDGQERFFHDPEAQVWATVDKDVKTEEDAFKKSALANHARENTTDVQEALAQRVFRDEFGWSDSKIASFYGYTNSNRVMYLKKLLDLPQEVIDRVHAGKLGLYPAIDLLKATPGTAVELVTQATTDDGKVDGSKIRELIRSQQPETVETAQDTEATTKTPTETPKATPRKKAESEAPDQTPKIKRTVRDATKFYEEVGQEETVAHPLVKELFATLSKWQLGGFKTDRPLWNAINAVTEGLEKADRKAARQSS